MTTGIIHTGIIRTGTAAGGGGSSNALLLQNGSNKKLQDGSDHQKQG